MGEKTEGQRELTQKKSPELVASLKNQLNCCVCDIKTHTA